MNINRKYIIIFGTLILLLVITSGAITYYNEKKEQANIFEDFQKRRINIFSQNYPTNLNEVLDFISFCKRGVFSGVEALKNEEIKKVACALVKVREDSSYVYAPSNSYTPIFTPLDSISSFKSDRYVGISVDLKDVISKDNPVLLEEKKLYVCSITEPSLTDPLISQLESKYDLFFNEGSVSCSEIKMDETSATIHLGFVPQAESLSIKEYLVDEQTVSDVLSKESFSEMKEMLNDYPVIWQMEKPINL